MEQGTPLLVTWVDAIQPSPAWQFFEDFTADEPLICQTLGWFHSESDLAMVLAQSISKSEQNDIQGSGFVVIPLRSIRSVEQVAGVMPDLVAFMPNSVNPESDWDEEMYRPAWAYASPNIVKGK